MSESTRTSAKRFVALIADMQRCTVAPRDSRAVVREKEGMRTTVWFAWAKEVLNVLDAFMPPATMVRPPGLEESNHALARTLRQAQRVKASADVKATAGLFYEWAAAMVRSEARAAGNIETLMDVVRVLEAIPDDMSAYVERAREFLQRHYGFEGDVSATRDERVRASLDLARKANEAQLPSWLLYGWRPPRITETTEANEP